MSTDQEFENSVRREFENQAAEKLGIEQWLNEAK